MCTKSLKWQILNYVDRAGILKGQWQGWRNTDWKDLIFIVVPCKGNAHRGKSANIEVGEGVTSYDYLENAALKFGTGSVK